MAAVFLVLLAALVLVPAALHVVGDEIGSILQSLLDTVVITLERSDISLDRA